jgi:hypothetical protein
VSSGVDVGDTRCGDLCGRPLQRVWRDVVQQLQCGLRVSGRRRDERHRRCVRCRSVQRQRRDVVQQLQRRLRVCRRVDVGDAGSGAVCCGQVQSLWCDGVQQL